MQMKEKYFIFLLGTKETKKSFFFKKITKNSNSNYNQPIGIEMKSKIYSLKEEKIILEINFIDTSISELNSNFFYSILNINKSAIILFFNFNNEKSLDYIKKWINDNKKIINETKIEFEGEEFFFPILILGISNDKNENFNINKIFLVENDNIFNLQIIDLNILKDDDISNIILNFFNNKINKYYGSLKKKLDMNECIIF